MARTKDSEKHKQAYLLYKKSKNLVKVSEELEISESSVRKWKDEEDWDNKIAVGQEKFSAFLKVMKDAEDNEILKSDLKDFRLLEQLEAIVAEKIYFEEIVPTNWNDIISTYRFVVEQKRLIQGKPTAHTVKDINVRVGSLSESELDTDIKRTQRAIAVAATGEST